MLRSWNSRDPYGVFYRHLLFNGDGGGEGGDGGGGSGGGDGGAGAEGAGSQGAEGKAPKTFTQAEVDEMLKGRIAENTRKAQKDLADSLGIPLEEAKAIIQAHNEKAEGEKNDAQKAKDAADKEKAAAESEKAAAAKERHDARIDRALLPEIDFPKDVKPEDRDAKLARVARLLDVEVGAEVEEIKAAITKLKKDEPALFGVSGNGSGTQSDPPGGKPPPKGSGDAFSRGAERAKGRVGRTAYPFEQKEGSTT